MKMHADNSRLAPLDTLRGLAITGVLLVHSSQVVSTGVAAADHALGWGRFGVQLFFIVSAFTMCHMWLLRRDEPDRTRNFYVRRFLRIAPLFWLAIPVYLLLNGTGPSYWAPAGIGAAEVTLTAVFLHALWPTSVTSVVPGGWSIGVEMLFYALFPLLAVFIGRGRPFLWLAVLVFVVNKTAIEPALRNVLGAHFADARETFIPEFLYLTFLNQLPVLLVGCYVFHAYQGSIGKLLREVIPPAGVLFLSAAVLTLIGRKPIGLDMLVALPLIFTLAVCVLRFNLSSTWLGILGKHSYGVYLSHFLVLHGIGAVAGAVGARSGLFPFATTISTAAVLSLLVAVVLHRLVEEPATRLTRLLTAPAGRGPKKSPQPFAR